MSLEFDATYRDGAIYPDSPLGLPDNTPVHVQVVAKQTDSAAPFPTTREEILALRPKSPRITPEEFAAIVAKHSVSVGSLPPDFSREDIYSDHD
jgi:hypothetical protein